MPFVRRRPYVSRFRSRLERDIVDHMGGGGFHRSEVGGGPCRTSYYHSRRGESSSFGSTGGGGYNSRDQWYRVLIPNGYGVSKSIVSTTVNDYSKKPIQLLNYHSEARSGRVLFYVHSREEAEEIRRLGKTISIQGKLTSLIVHRVDEPNYALESDTLSMLRDYLQSRYNAEVEMLDLSNFAENQDLQSMGVYVSLRRAQSYEQIMELLEELFPNLKVLNLSTNMLTSLEFLRNRFKSVERLNISNNQIHRLRELDALRHMRLIEINIAENPLTNQFSSIEDFSSLMREKHPRLIAMNGMNLPPKIGFAVDDDTNSLPETLYHYVPDDLKSGVMNFIKLYFDIFDSDNRQSLINAYHENAALSLAINSIRANRFERYAKEGRNFLKINDEVIDELPKERERFHIRSFCRTFHCIIESGGMIIVSEHMHIREANENQARFMLNNTPSPNSKSENPMRIELPSAEPASNGDNPVSGRDNLASPQRDSEQSMLIEKLMKATGMNYNYSQQCLSENNWDFNRACSDFLDLNVKITTQSICHCFLSIFLHSSRKCLCSLIPSYRFVDGNLLFHKYVSSIVEFPMVPRKIET